MEPEMIKLLERAIDAMKKGLRVEWSMDKDGNIRAQTISRKLLK